MKKKKTPFLYFLLFALFFCACTTSDEPEISADFAMKDALLSLRFSLPQTYGVDNEYITPEEAEFKSIDVYIYTDNSCELSV